MKKKEIVVSDKSLAITSFKQTLALTTFNDNIYMYTENVINIT